MEYALKRLSHSLKKLWREYKAEYFQANLHRHDKSINQLDKFEEIRYPNPAHGSIGISMQWSGNPPTVKTCGGLRTPRQYALAVDAIDDLVADILKISSWNASVIMHGNKAALAAIMCAAFTC